MPISSSSHAGKVINGRYRVITLLGSGPNGQVYLGDDIRLRKQVTVKLLHDNDEDERGLLDNFQDQAQLAESLRHTNIVSVQDWGHTEIPFVVSEYMGGGSLRNMLNRVTSLTLAQVLVVGIGITEGLEHGHNRGLVHQGVKPENILFDAEGTIKIADFGLVKSISGLSDLEYASPEFKQSKSVGTASDIYSLALVLYESVTGENRLHGTGGSLTFKERTDQEIVPPIEFFGGLAPTIGQALSAKPSERPDAETFRNMLLKASKDLSRPDPLPIESGFNINVIPEALNDPTNSPESRKRNVIERVKTIYRYITSRLTRWAWLLLMTAVIVGIALLVYANNVDPPPSIRIIPNAVGLTPEVFEEEVGGFWDLQEALTREDGSVFGTILSTSPPSGEELEEGGQITYFVSQGPELRDIPLGLAGLTVDEAEEVLLGARLRLGSIIQQPDEDIGAGLIVGVANSDMELPTDSAVDLIISAGPELRVIPNGLEGLPFEDAETAVVLEGLQVRKREIHSEIVPEGIVVQITPGSSTSVLRDSFVEVVVSIGPESES